MKFIADSMLGTLTRWLRAMGYDVAYDPDLCDRLLMRNAREQGRILLTRDTHLIQVRDCPPHLFIKDNSLAAQLAQVIEEFNLETNEINFLTRCLECNGLLQEVEKNTIREAVPPYVFATQDSFRRCPGCYRIYWGGTHLPRLKAKLFDLLNRASIQG